MIAKIYAPTRLLREGSLPAIRVWTWGCQLGLKGITRWPGDEIAAEEADLTMDEVEDAIDELEMMKLLHRDMETGEFQMVVG